MCPLNSRSISMAVRTAFVTAWIFLATIGALASTALLRSTPEAASQVSTVQTPLGNVNVAAVPVPRPSPSITVLILVDSLTDNELANDKNAILKLCAASRGRPLRLAVLQNGSLGMAAPLSTCTRVRAALDQVRASPSLARSEERRVGKEGRFRDGR